MTRLFNLGDLREAIKGMPDAVTLSVRIGDMSVPIDRVSESAAMAGRWPPANFILVPDEAWLVRGLVRREAKERT